MDGSGWVLRAIEQEADARAMRKLHDDPSQGISHVFCISPRQVLWLRNEWQQQNPGKQFHEIPE